MVVRFISLMLDDLEITVNGEVKRRVKFQKGLNLVTNKPGSGRTGNSVGKSTLSRVVEFLMLGDLSGVYVDEEFKKPNQEIESLFLDNKVIASLSFTNFSGELKSISRSMTLGDDVVELFFVDGNKVEAECYEVFLQTNILNIHSRRPSVRSLAPKIIRNNSRKMLNTTKFLDRNASAKDYSELFLYLFGFDNTDLLTDKRDATNLFNRRRRNSRSINAMVKEQKPSKEIKKFRKDASELEKNLLEFDYSPEYTNPVERLSGLQAEEDKFTSTLLSVERKIGNIERTIKLLSKDQDGYLVRQMKAIYDFSGVSVDSALNDLEKVIDFHKNLVDRKKQYLSVDIPKLQLERDELTAEINAVRRDKTSVFSDVRSKESLDNITKNLKRLGELKVELGKLEGLVGQQQKAKTDLNSAERNLQLILESISQEMDNVHSFEKVFNKYLRIITKKLLDDEYEVEVNFDEKAGTCDVDLKNSVTNPEGGKKKIEVISFDFAYIFAIQEFSLKRACFVFHDSIEDIDSKQIKDIFEISRTLPGQQILSMLSDKLDPETYNEVYPSIVLSLDEDEKFFNV